MIINNKKTLLIKRVSKRGMKKGGVELYFGGKNLKSLRKTIKILRGGVKIIS